MSNNWFNFKLPEFYEKYGSDWDDFSDIIEDNTDYAFLKTWQLYHIIDITRMPLRVTEWWLDLLRIGYDEDDTLTTKKAKLRFFANKYANKGLAEIYIDVAREVSGVDGSFRLPSGDAWTWGSARPAHWSGSIDSRHMVWFEPGTSDSDELDAIQALFQSKEMRPAFYKMYLVDSGDTILREI